MWSPVHRTALHQMHLGLHGNQQRLGCSSKQGPRTGYSDGTELGSTHITRFSLGIFWVTSTQIIVLQAEMWPRTRFRSSVSKPSGERDSKSSFQYKTGGPSPECTSGTQGRQASRRGEVPRGPEEPSLRGENSQGKGLQRPRQQWHRHLCVCFFFLCTESSLTLLYTQTSQNLRKWWGWGGRKEK